MEKMEKAVYFSLIFCVIISQGICNVYKRHNESSSNLLIRQKRVAGGVKNPLEAAPYLLAVLENESFYCSATLLTTDVAISSADCFVNRNPNNLKIISRQIVGTLVHDVVRVIFLDPNYNSEHRTLKNLALVRFSQPIQFQTSLNRPISVYTGNLALDHSISQVIGFGRPLTEGGKKLPPVHIRSITAVLISFEHCQEIYPNTIHLGNICAVGTHPMYRCDYRDTGIPLVMSNQLLGIFVYRKNNARCSDPNVFMNLLDHSIRRWIHEHVPSLSLF